MFDFTEATANGTLWTEVFKARIPPGFRDRLADAAAAEGVTMSEFARRALTDRIEAVEAILEGQTEDALRI